MRHSPSFRDLPEEQRRSLDAAARNAPCAEVYPSPLPRFAYVVKAVRVLVGPPDGAPTEMFVVTQQLCAKGVTFVTSRSVAVGTTLSIDLLRLDHHVTPTAATVVGGQSTGSDAHLIGAEFDAPIVVSEFIMLDDG